MSEHAELDELVGTEEEVVENAPTGTEPEAEGDDTATSQTPTQDPAQGAHKAPESVPFSALLEERTKRQELQRQIEELRQGTERKPPPEPESPPDWLGDPELAAQHMQQQITQATRAQVVNLSRSMMMSARPDYEAREAEFIDLAVADPALVRAMNEADNPALYAYETAVKHARMRSLEEIGDIDEWRTAESKRLRAEIEAEQLAGRSGNPRMPPSMARATEATGGHVTPTDEALDEILGR